MSNENQSSATGLAVVTSGNTELAQVNAAMPDFMMGQGGTGTEQMRQYIRPSRIKIVQPTSSGVFKENYHEGDAVLVPQMIHLLAYDRKAPANNRLWFTPLFMFAEYLFVNPIDTKGTEPFVIERTTNPKSEVARRAKSEKERNAPHPNPSIKNPRKYIETLNFVSILHVQGFELTPVVFSFMNAEHKSGETLCALVTMRRVGQSQAPLFGCVFQAEVRYRTNNKGQWYGFDVTNPSADSGFSPFIQSPELFQQYAALHDELATAFRENRLDVDYEDGETSNAANTATGGYGPNSGAVSGEYVNGEVVGSYSDNENPAF